MFNKIVYSMKTVEINKKTFKMLTQETIRPLLHYYNNISI